MRTLFPCPTCGAEEYSWTDQGVTAPALCECSCGTIFTIEAKVRITHHPCTGEYCGGGPADPGHGYCELCYNTMALAGEFYGKGLGFGDGPE
jgi:hypothetical protein